MTQLSIDFGTRVRAARKLGTDAGEHARAKADGVCPGFSVLAYDFIVVFAATTQGTFSGEDLTNRIKAFGIVPHDDRSFGAIFAKAIRNGVIRGVGYVPRVKGHGTSGGRLYASGVCA